MSTFALEMLPHHLVTKMHSLYHSAESFWLPCLKPQANVVHNEGVIVLPPTDSLQGVGCVADDSFPFIIRGDQFPKVRAKQLDPKRFNSAGKFP